jgi:anti-sigma factor ChrR (cupin superfamily)
LLETVDFPVAIDPDERLAAIATARLANPLATEVGVHRKLPPDAEATCFRVTTVRRQLRAVIDPSPRGHRIDMRLR